LVMDDDVLGRKEETKLERDDDEEADGTEYTLVRWGLVPMAESGRSRTNTEEYRSTRRRGRCKEVGRSGSRECQRVTASKTSISPKDGVKEEGSLFP
jgi:hypothetical protein